MKGMYLEGSIIRAMELSQGSVPIACPSLQAPSNALRFWSLKLNRPGASLTVVIHGVMTLNPTRECLISAPSA